MTADNGRRPAGRLVRAVALFALILVALAPVATSIHFYRGSGSGCSPADGQLTDDPGGEVQGEVAATVLMTHNTFNDQATLAPVTHIQAGEAVTWIWNSEHCHSVQHVPTEGDTEAFYSGFHYPSEAPTTPEAVPGLFHYPVPTDEPTLSFTHTFQEPGTYVYVCEHHGVIGMVGLVVVE